MKKLIIYMILVFTTLLHAETLSLQSGWNLVGANSSLTIEELKTKMVSSNLLVVQGQNKTYQKSYADEGKDFLNSFTAFEKGRGYWIKVNSAVDVAYNKVTYTTEQNINLIAGWNLINPPTDLNISEIITQLGNNLEVIQGQNKTYQKAYVDEGKEFLNSFKKFEEPQGYWVKVASDAMLNFPALNVAPTITGTVRTVTNQYDSYHFLPKSNDVNGDGLTFSIVNKPKWAEFNSSTGLLSGVALEGSYNNITISVSDGSEKVSLAPFNIEVNPAVDIAHKYGIATQGTDSSYYYYSAASLTIDNNDSTFNHTSGGADGKNWLQIELPNPTKIHRIVIQNRGNNAYRLTNAKVYISNKPYSGTIDESIWVKTLQVTNDEQIIDLASAQSGQYLIIKGETNSNDNRHIHLKKVEVYGEIPDKPYFTMEQYNIGITSDSSGQIAQIKALDYQEDYLTYTLTGDAGFTIGEDGAIVIDSSLIDRSKVTYTLRLQVSDGLHESNINVEVVKLGCHGVNLSRYNNIDGGKVSDFLNSDRVNSLPDAYGIVSNIDFKENKSNSYALKYETLFKVPKSARYQFAIVGDDETQFELYSLNNKKLITIKGPNYAAYKDWSKAGKSDYLALQEGEVYSIKAYLKENSGAEHIAVGMRVEGEASFSLLPEEQLYRVAFNGGDCQKSCIDGLSYELLSSDTLYGNYGTVFSSTEYVANEVSTYNPQKIKLVTKKDNIPFIGCKIVFTPENNSGWVYDANTSTDSNGISETIWVAGEKSDTQTLKVESDNGYVEHIEGVGLAGPNTRADSIHLYYHTNRYQEFSVSAHPLNIDKTTYFSLLNWEGSYMGIQFNGDTSLVIFSTWDVGDRKAEIIDQGASNKQVGFGGEGTGASVRLYFPPEKYGHIDGLPDDYCLEVGGHYTMTLKLIHPTEGCDDANSDNCTDYEVNFYDKDRGFGPIKVGTLRYKYKVAASRRASSFVEDWAQGDTCLNSGRRTIEYYDVKYLDDATKLWKDINSASFSGVYRPDNTEICVNYKSAGVKDGFLMSSGGKNPDFMGKPLIWDRNKIVYKK